MSILWLNLLIFIPFFAYKIAQRKASRYVYCITGASFGAVITPIGFGLYACYFIPIIGVVPGILGLILVMFHEIPGYHLAVNLGVIPVGKVVSGFTQRAIIEVINGTVWLICYGGLGYLTDLYRVKRKRN